MVPYKTLALVSADALGSLFIFFFTTHSTSVYVSAIILEPGLLVLRHTFMLFLLYSARISSLVLAEERCCSNKKKNQD